MPNSTLLSIMHNHMEKMVEQYKNFKTVIKADDSLKDYEVPSFELFLLESTRAVIEDKNAKTFELRMWHKDHEAMDYSDKDDVKVYHEFTYFMDEERVMFKVKDKAVKWVD